MSKFNPTTHITGKVYDLTQENFNALLADWERLREVCKTSLPEADSTNTKASQAVLDLALALRSLNRAPTLMDLVKLSRRIRKS